MKDSDKQRYAIEGNTIRALYGHSVPVEPLTPPTEPPEKLYHGTTHVAAEFIVDEGLKKRWTAILCICLPIPRWLFRWAKDVIHTLLYSKWLREKLPIQEFYFIQHKAAFGWLMQCRPISLKLLLSKEMKGHQDE